MPSIQKVFLASVKRDWSSTFPYLKSVELNEVPKREKGCTFMYETEFKTTGFVFFIAFQFSKTRIGEFTIDISISTNREHSVLDRRWAQDLSVLRAGSYRIATFLNTGDFWWALADVEARSRDLIMDADEMVPAEPALTLPNRWRPTSFDLPQNEIVLEAIADVNSKLRSTVFPRLRIKF